MIAGDFEEQDANDQYFGNKEKREQRRLTRERKKDQKLGPMNKITPKGMDKPQVDRQLKTRPQAKEFGTMSKPKPQVHKTKKVDSSKPKTDETEAAATENLAQAGSKFGSTKMWWYIGGAVVLIGGLIVLAKMTHSQMIKPKV